MNGDTLLLELRVGRVGGFLVLVYVVRAKERKSKDWIYVVIVFGLCSVKIRIKTKNEYDIVYSVLYWTCSGNLKKNEY